MTRTLFAAFSCLAFALPAAAQEVSDHTTTAEDLTARLAAAEGGEAWLAVAQGASEEEWVAVVIAMFAARPSCGYPDEGEFVMDLFPTIHLPDEVMADFGPRTVPALGEAVETVIEDESLMRTDDETDAAYLIDCEPTG